MKIYWLTILLCLSGCQKQKDETLVTWIKKSWEIDVRVSRGFPTFENGLSSTIHYDGKSPEKAAKTLAKTEPKYKILGPVIDVHKYMIFPDQYCVHAEESGVNGYIVFKMISDPKRNYVGWTYRFFPQDYFIKIEQSSEKENGA